MYRLLIADPVNILSSTLRDQLSDRFSIEICRNGKEVLKTLHTFHPDVILLDLKQPDMDGLHLLHGIRSGGFTSRIIVLTALSDDYTLSVLESMGVCQVFLKPYVLQNLVHALWELSFEAKDIRHWCLELETDRLYFSLSFRPSGIGYRRVHEAQCIKYNDPEATVTKHIYPYLVKKHGGNDKQIEKLIHNTIKTAWNRGNQELWQMYFPYLDIPNTCPSNDEFLSRMEHALRSREYFSQNCIVELKKVL